MNTTLPGSAEADLAPLLEPLQLKNVRLRNRIVRSAHGSGLSLGMVTDDLVAYHVMRARNGVALSFAESAQVHWSSPGFLDNTTDAVIDGLARMADAVHAEGMAMFHQLMHGGPTVVPHDGSAPWAASAIPDQRLSIVARPMTKAMIDEVVAGFADAAARARRAGLDGVEVHGGHGYLFSAFLSPATNLRTDDYGGSLENRARILFEVLAAIRVAVGDEFVIGVRLSPDGAAGHTTAEDIIDVVAMLEDHALIDYLNVSWGSHYRQDKLIGTTRLPQGYMLPVVGQITRATSLPTLVTGRVLTLDHAAEIVRSGQAELVSMVRALLADPELITKTLAGRTDEIRPCISCNQACAGGLNTKGRIGCVVNVGGGKELRLGDHMIEPTSDPKRVLVVGGGPAGMEAARVAALTGHEVTLVEAVDRLGGQLRLVEQSPSRTDVASLIPYFERALSLAGVEVQLGRTITAGDVDAYEPDAIVIATGSTPRRDGFQAWVPGQPLPGIDQVELLTGWDVLEGAELTGPVMLVDELGHYESFDVSEALVKRGLEVHHVTRFHSLGAAIPLNYEFAAAPHTEELMKGNFHLHTRSLVVRVAPGSATICHLDARHREEQLAVEHFVFMSGHVPDDSLPLALAGRPNVITIGDALGPRLMEAAFADGFNAARQLEKDWQRPTWIRFSTGSAV
jgi:2,4-dienoyl-CoA reductase-like NADH-dependent reductase (Old Yellow Enzyme family)